MEKPRCCILMSGKRKSGKDFVAERLTELIKQRLQRVDAVVHLRIAESLKRRYAVIHGVDADKLMDASEFKDLHRTRMIEWSENVRQTSGDFCQFCRAACDSALAASTAPIWIVVDCRRHFELKYFHDNDSEGRLKGNIGSTITVRVVATEETRKSRGWKFIAGADDIDSECGLDDWLNWDFIISNDSADSAALDRQLQPVVRKACENFA